MKRKVIRILAYGVGFFVLVIALVLSYIKVMLPNVGEAPTITVEITDERLQRGEYLANHVMVCMDCHSERDYSIFTAPMVAGTEGQGGELFDQNLGFPGRYISPNITPAKLGNWTDGEIFRAVTSGVAKDGRALFPIMPHPNYGKLDKEDIYAVIAYIRSLKPIKHETEASASDFPMNLIINTIPKEAQLSTRPAETDLINYGKYLVTAASCNDCHTRQEKGQFVGQPFAGGMEFKFPDGAILRSANITPHETGIGSWNEEQFIQRFKAFSKSDYTPHRVPPGEFQTLMPWTFYAEMKTEDLKAIYAYLKTLEPVDQTVTLFTPAQ
ncbi:c-type cytochrome [Sunxiuqinia elliptica]|uniref:Cytochrome c n=1 Tax=Sunxiuqinia elliptica TaxID=655355 RepID=A0A1I2FD33_9BACT|nr:cytochrome c [Sunxiuqinia elliptica]SFF02667.1 Cytochrome c [Sunxiuqinia elliptica]